MAIAEVLEVISNVNIVINAVTAIVNGIKTFVEVVIDAAKAIGIIKSDVNAETLGTQSLQAKDSGIEFGAEGFDTYKATFDEVSNVTIDTEKSNNYSPEDKLRAAGELVTGVLIESHPGIEKILKLATSGDSISSFFTPARIAEYIKSDVNFTNVAAYLKGTMVSDDMISQTADELKHVEKNISPELSEQEISRITDEQFGSVN
ncbi:MAG: hypothetical protein J6A05_07755 [Oscillospiraceae bacterium]|nr:hypothetical protein [Oscillospiraceae bacterium]